MGRLYYDIKESKQALNLSLADSYTRLIVLLKDNDLQYVVDYFFDQVECTVSKIDKSLYNFTIPYYAKYIGDEIINRYPFSFF